MRRELKIWAVILGIVVTGMGITKFTDAYVSNKRTQMDMAGLAQPGEEGALEEAEEEPMEAEGALPFSAVAGAGTADRRQAAAGAGQTAKNGDEPAMAAATDPGQEALPGPDGGPGSAAGMDTGDTVSAGPDTAADDAAGADGSARKAAGLQGSDTAGSAPLSGVADAQLQDSLAQGMGGAASSQASMGTPALTAGSPGAAAGEKVEEEAVLTEGAADTAEDYRVKLEAYLYRLPELDAQIQRMRSAETENTVQSVKSAAKTEQRIWERELEAVYSLLISSLDEEAGDALREEQQTWIIERDIAAQEASRKNSGSMENVEYTASIAASTRERVYELVDLYR